MRILVIEDYAPLRKSIVQGLEEAQFAVDSVADGRAGLTAALVADYDVIVLDLMLPELDGISVLRELRSTGSKSTVLILSAKVEVEQRVEGLELGADDYLTKPFAFPELLARVHALVRRRYQSNNPIIQVHDLYIDTSSRTVRRGNIPIELSPKEFVLLEYLARRTGQVVTRMDIWNHIYDFQGDQQSNVVDVYIGYLRKKIELGNHSRLIHTRRGFGYMLGAPS